MTNGSRSSDRKDAPAACRTITGVEMEAEGRRGLVARLWREVTAFGVVGAAAFVIDNGGYNILVFGLPGRTPGPLTHHAILASVLATAAATLVSWVGNRLWTYRHQRRDKVTHELALFVVVNLLGIGITALPVLMSRSLFGFSSVLSDNVARLLGWTLATLFRFFSYRSVVFRQDQAEAAGIAGETQRG